MASASSGSGGQLPPPYGSGSPSHSASSGTLPRGFKLDREFTMLPSRDDRDKMKIQAEVYAMLTTVDCLEDMFASGYVEKSDYEPICGSMIQQFVLKETRLQAMCGQTSRQLVEAHGIRAPLGVRRLIDERMLPWMGGASSRDTGTAAALEAGVSFVTMQDALQMGQKTKEELWPVVRSIVSVLGRIPSLPADFHGVETLKRWMQTLHDMTLDDELDDDQIRQFRLDIDACYSALQEHLGGHAPI